MVIFDELSLRPIFSNINITFLSQTPTTIENIT